MKKMKAMKNKMKFRYMVLVFIMVFVGVCGYLGYQSDAAEDMYLSCDGYELDAATAYQMKNKQITLILGSQEDPIYADKSKYEVRWSIETGKEIAEITQGSEQIYGIVSAKSPGEVTVLATVYNKVGDEIGTTVGSVTCKIQVVFAIDTSTDDNVFKYPYADSTDKAIFLRTEDDPVPLSLNYGDSKDAQWTIANTEIAEISDDGIVTAKGAGSTKITSTYTPPDSPNTTYTTTIDVYVYPNVNKEDSNYQKNIAFGLNSGETIYTDTIFDNNFEAIQRKMAWVIKKDDGNGGEYIVADSLGKTSDLIEISAVSSRSNQLRVDATAGKYYVYFYPKNAYESEDKYISEEVYPPTILTLSVYANFNDYEETIPIGSIYDIADAFNLTQEEFMQYFNVTPSSNAGAFRNYAILDKSIVTATGKNKGQTTIVTVEVTVKDEYRYIITELLDPAKVELAGRTKFDVDLTIADVFSLDQTYMTMYAGGKINLNAYFNSQVIAATNVKWSSSNVDYATVSATGEVEAVKVTKEDVVITATYNNSVGAEFKATCQIKIIQTADNLEISQTRAELNVGESIILNVTSNPEVAYPPYIWLPENDAQDYITITPTADNKTATITAKKVPAEGDAVVVSVVNPLNKVSVYCTITINAPYEELKLTEDSVTMKAGASHQLRYDYKPSNVTQTELTWKSLDTSIVTVDEYGTLTAHAPGMTYIMVSPTYNPNGVYAQCAISVLAGCEKLELSENKVTLNAEEERVVKVTLEPKGCITTLEWSVTNEEVASVTYDEATSQATIVGKKAGQAIIFVKSEDGPSAQIDVTVLQPCLELSFSPQEYEMKAGETYTPGLVKTPEDATDEITWSSYDSAIATVDAKGIITAVKTGTTFIQATSASGRVAVLKINVKEGLTSVTLKPEETEVEVGQTITLAPEFTPVVAYDKSMTWTVADSSVAKIEPEGTSNVKVTGLVGGVTLVKGVAKDGGFVVSCLVKVKEKSTAVTVNPTTKYLQKGKTFTIKAEVTSETATDKSITWSTSKKKVATVSSSGVVKGKKIGTAYITATANDGSGASARCKVMVVRKVTSLKLNKYKAKVLVGDTCKLKATIKPKNATIKGIEWSSSDNTIATVDSSGRIHGIAAGLVKIRAKAKDGSGKSAVCLVTVMDPVPATGVDVANNDLIVAKGRQIQSGIRIAPANSTDKIKYFSDNKKVAKINKRGKIYAKKVGQATVYGETSNGQMGYADVLVVAMNRKRLTLRTYDTETLRVDEISQGVTWYSKNPLIASVDQSGKVVGRRRGTTRIYAKVRGLRLSCKVTVTGLN